MKSQNSPLLTNVVLTSLGTLEVEGTTSGAEPTSKTRTKFKGSYVPYNLFLPTKVEPRRSQTKNKTHDSFVHVCHKIAVFLPHPMLAHLIHVKKDLRVICVSYVLFAQTHGYDSNCFGRDVGTTTSGIMTTLICKGSIECGREGIKLKPLLGICK